MNRLVVCAIAAITVGVVACSDENTDNGQNAGIGTFASAVMSVDSSPVVLHVFVDPDDTTSYLSSDAVDRTPVITLEPSGEVVPNGNDNVSNHFSNGNVEFDDNGELVGTAPGTTVLTYVFTDYNHNRATQTINIPITVVVGPAPVPSIRVQEIGAFVRSR